MGTVSLLKCYRPLFSTLFPRSPPSTPHAAIFRRKNPRSFCACSSPPLTAEKDCGKSDAEGFTLKKTAPEVWLHNTMSKTKQLFKPKVESKVGMYVCGVTAYDLSHIGHARVYINFDLLYRYFKHLGFEVCYVRNFTDVDDKDLSLHFSICR